MKIVLTGSSGLVGSALSASLAAAGHHLTRLRHAKPWPDLEGHDAVVHLAGESIAAGRWTAERKRRIHESRSELTRRLSEAVAALTQPPQVLISASAIGIYGDRGDQVLREEHAPAGAGDDEVRPWRVSAAAARKVEESNQRERAHGAGFLVEVCRDWEAATAPAAGKGIRVVNLRFGLILGAAGGALAKMLPPFKLGAGGVIGDGRQYMSWIALDDVIGVIHHALTNGSLRGAVNVVAPNPVTNREFTRTLGRVLRRPTIFPLPAFAARLAFGEMADALLLSSQRVEPARLAASGYAFRFPELEAALRHVLAR